MQILSHTKGLPHALVLENSSRERFVMLPNYGVKRVKIKTQPFSTEIVLDRSVTWSKEVKTRFYVYPVHLSGAFMLTPSLPSAFYLVVLRLL